MTRQECVYLHLQKYRPSKMNKVRAIAFVEFLQDLLDTHKTKDCAEWFSLSINKYRSRKRSYYNWIKILEEMDVIETKLETKIYKQHPNDTLTYKKKYFKINKEKIENMFYQPPV